MSNTPSIGSIGVTVDENNQRVKVLHAEIFSSVEQVKTCLIEDIAGNCDAEELLGNSNARFTARIIGKRIGYVRPFVVPSGILVREEARIPVRDGELEVIY